MPLQIQQSNSLYIYLFCFFYLFIHLFIYLFIYLFICLVVHLFIYLFSCSFIYLFILFRFIHCIIYILLLCLSVLPFLLQGKAEVEQNQEIKKAMITEQSLRQQWKSLTKKVTHERAIWPNPEKFRWILDMTEGKKT
jgi:hypothetical protein